MGAFTEHISAGMDALRSFAGETVVCWRGGKTGEFIALQTRRPYEVTDDQGLVTEILSEDFLVAAADYELDDVVELPAVGDRIEIASGEQFEVVPLAGGNHFDYRDTAKAELRIHTKRVKLGPS